MSDPVRIGFVGCGMVSELHAAAIARSRDAVLAAVHDADQDLAGRRAERWSCSAVPTADELFARPDLDAVFVLTPTAHHAELARRALGAGKHVLVEKPVATGFAELESLAQVAQTSGRVCMPGHNYAYVPELRRIARLAREGRLGEVRLLSIVFAIAHEEEVAAHYDGVLRLVMPHHAYLAQAILGTPARVQAGITDSGWESLDRDDQCWIALDYPPRSTALLFASLAVDDQSADPWSFVVKALGTAGSATASWRAGVIASTGGSMSTGYAPYEESYEHELDAFCRAVRGDLDAILSTLDDALAAERVLQAAAQAASLGRAVSL
jgi:myo-inositol 2-dehydrogenase / D-chiro-inositol 1-dehydrogenase